MTSFTNRIVVPSVGGHGALPLLGWSSPRASAAGNSSWVPPGRVFSSFLRGPTGWGESPGPFSLRAHN
jgi:hypothetical protein